MPTAAHETKHCNGLRQRYIYVYYSCSKYTRETTGMIFIMFLYYFYVLFALIKLFVLIALLVYKSPLSLNEFSKMVSLTAAKTN